MAQKKDKEELRYPMFKVGEQEATELRIVINNIKDICRHYNNLHLKLCEHNNDYTSISSMVVACNHDVDANSDAASSMKETVSRKRRYTDDTKTDKKVKKAKLNPSVTTTVTKDGTYTGPSLLILSDDVLLNIFQHLHPFDLFNVSRTCVRLSNVCRDRSLWIDIDFRFEEVYMKKVIDFSKFLKFILPTTKSIRKSALTILELVEYACSTALTTQVSITPKFIKAVAKKATSLKSLAIENHILCASKFTLDCLPQSLEFLSLKNTAVIQSGEKSYFYQIHLMLPNLKVLDLSGCQWFRSQSFLALSKIPTLQELYLKGCLSLEECVPYASLASSFGFPSLELLDLRLTQVSDSDVCCFNRVKYLKKLYLESVNWHTPNSISDISIVSFGKSREPPQGFELSNYVIIRNRNFQKPLESLLETLVIRNFLAITDITLKHAASCLPFLKQLDVRGTSCSEEGVVEFKRLRPEVELYSDFDSSLVEESVL